MGKVNVYIPDTLEAAARAEKLSWSPILQQGIREALGAKSRKKVKRNSGTFNDLAKRSWHWAHAYRPARFRTDDALFAHTHCEVSEAWKECREGRLETFYENEWRPNEGVALANKPKGLPAELADVVIMACVIAGKHKIDLDAAIAEKFAELDSRLAQKLERKLA